MAASIDSGSAANGGKHVLLLGASGTAGHATGRALMAAGHRVTCLLRPSRDLPDLQRLGAEIRHGEITDEDWLKDTLFADVPYDTLVSCLASRSGAPADAWAIDYQANANALRAAQKAGIGQMLLLSAICVQKPKLAFQEAKLAFEAELIASGLTYSIIRPTAFFKSLSGQIARVQKGQPFLLFGDGKLTACKPISDADLGRYIADCVTNAERHNKILPIGGPGPALTPLEQGKALFTLTGQEPRFRRLPMALMDVIIGGLSLAGLISAKAAEKAELARIGRYYASESMLVWDEQAGRYDAEATPETGQDRLTDYYQQVLNGEAEVDLGDHAVF